MNARREKDNQEYGSQMNLGSINNNLNAK